MWRRKGERLLLELQRFFYSSQTLSMWLLMHGTRVGHLLLLPVSKTGVVIT